MKYLVAWAWEMDGHAGAAAMVCDTRQAVKDYIDQCLKDDEGNPMGQITSSNLTDTGYVYYGTWDCGDFSITITKFKNYSAMINKEVFARTG